MTTPAQRIVHVPRRFVAHEWGGTETVIAELLREQRRGGLQPEIHTSLALSDVRRETWQELEIFRYPYCYPFFGLNATQRLAMDKKGGNLLSWSLLWALLRRPDVRLFHAHALKRLGGEVFTAARLRKRPFVVTLHGGVFDVPAAELAQITEAQAGKFEWGRVCGALLRSRNILHEADAVICVGASEAEKARAQLGHDRIHHLGNGVDPARFADGDRQAFRARLGLTPDAVVFSCISRFDPQKDQLTLIEAFDRVAAARPEVHLVMAGPATAADYVKRVEQRIAASPHAARIHKLGAINPAGRDLADALAGIDVFVLPSRHEPFGIVVLEAWCAGRPVIVSRVGGLQSLVAEGRTGAFFSAGEAGDLAERMTELVLNPDRRKAWGAAGGAEARAHHTWRQIATRTEAIYQEAEARVAGRKG
ncbi:MAG: glycosyltransferase family 4 protein [Opitutaceae bacterium]